MIREEIIKLKDVIDYFKYHNKNLTKQQDYELEKLKDIYDKLSTSNVYFEVARYEVETAIEDIYNDELYGDYKDKLDKITGEEINQMAWSVSDDDCWEDVYDYARNIVYDKIGVGIDD